MPGGFAGSPFFINCEDIINFKSISYKLYLTLQGIIFTIGVVAALFHLTAVIHDTINNSSALDCINNNLGKSKSIINLPSKRWSPVLNESLNTLSSRQYKIENGKVFNEGVLHAEWLRRKCGKYVAIYDPDSYSKVFITFIKGDWFYGDNPTFGRFLSWTGGFLLTSWCLMLILFLLRKWLGWIFKDENSANFKS